ncbi:MAG: FAD:protein FMN transferase [Desulfosudis oleivorans]|nr:FAD:protein FMN transferase [Desulfosudis oleivorans]
MTVTGDNEQALRGAVDAAYAEMDRLIKLMSHYDESSVVSAISHSAGRQPVAVPPELMTVLQMAQNVSARSDGAFDITIGGLKGWQFDPARPRAATAAEIAAQRPNVDYRRLRLDPVAGTAFLERPGMRLDLGAIAKLPIVAAGMQALERHGVRNAMINGGGDVQVHGRMQQRPWRVGIRDGHRPGELYAALPLERGFVVSSGDYERRFERDGKRYHHILDPRTGYPVQGVQGVTLVAERLEDINGLSAAVMVLGPERGRQLIENSPGVEESCSPPTAAPGYRRRWPRASSTRRRDRPGSVGGGTIGEPVDQLIDGLGLHVEADLGARIERDRVVAPHLFQHPGELGQYPAAVPRVVLDEILGTVRAREHHQHRRAVLGRQHQRLGAAGALDVEDRRLFVLHRQIYLRGHQGLKQLVAVDATVLGIQQLLFEFVARFEEVTHVGVSEGVDADACSGIRDMNSTPAGLRALPAAPIARRGWTGLCPPGQV